MMNQDNDILGYQAKLYYSVEEIYERVLLRSRLLASQNIFHIIMA